MNYKISYDYGYEVLKTFALTHNYNLWIVDMLRPYIGKKVLEVGVGTGNLTTYLNKIGSIKKYVGIDKSERYINHLKIDLPYIELYQFDITDKKILTFFGEESFDTILCINVLEHIPNDILALENMFKLLKPQGKVLLFVPALRWLYGSLDEMLQHYRRYEKDEVIEKLDIVKFKVIEISFVNFVGMIGWFINGKILRRKKFSILQPLMFDKIIPIVEKIEKVIPPVIGMSIFAVGVK